MKEKMGNGDFENGEPPEVPDFDGKTPPDGKYGQKMDKNREMGQPPQNGDFEKGGMKQPPQGDMPNAEGRGDGMNFGEFGRIDDETAAAHAITINGGNIYIKASGDGIDSNGSLTITGGIVKINGPETNGNGPLDSEGTMTITGGEVITLSSAGMLQLPNSSDTQNTIKAVFNTQGVAGDTVTIKDSNGNEIMESIAEGKYIALIYSSKKIKEGEQYSIYVNDNLYETVTASKGVTSIGKSVGFMDGFGGKDMKEKTVSDKNEILGKIL